MPKRRTLTAMPVDREHLDALIARGAISDVLYARERFMEAESFARYVRPLVGKPCSTCGHPQEEHEKRG